MGTGMALSTWSSTSMEDIAKTVPGGLRWLQINIFKDRELLRNFVTRAESSGYRALFVSTDKPVAGKGHFNQHGNFLLPPQYRYCRPFLLLPVTLFSEGNASLRHSRPILQSLKTS